MRVFVTGGCGFLGSHVCEFYARRGDQVVSFDLMTKFELRRNPYAAEDVRDYNWKLLEKLGVTLIKGDIRNYEEMADAAAGADFIVHTAAQPAMTISVEEPELDFSTNVVGTYNVLRLARTMKLPVVSCATIHIYGNLINDCLSEGETRYLCSPASIDETHSTLEGKLSPLHASKMAGDIYVRTFIDSYGLEAASFRLTGIYGPRQFGGEDHGWVANFAIRALMGLPLNVFNNGKQVRDILFVSDVARAIHAFYEHRVPGVYNIGGDEKNAISLIESIEFIGEVLGKKPEVVLAGERYGDLYYFVCNCQKARKQLQWEAETDPKSGITQLLDWLQANQQLFSAGASE